MQNYSQYNASNQPLLRNNNNKFQTATSPPTKSRNVGEIPTQNNEQKEIEKHFYDKVYIGEGARTHNLDDKESWIPKIKQSPEIEAFLNNAAVGQNQAQINPGNNNICQKNFENTYQRTENVPIGGKPWQKPNEQNPTNNNQNSPNINQNFPQQQQSQQQRHNPLTKGIYESSENREKLILDNNNTPLQNFDNNSSQYMYESVQQGHIDQVPQQVYRQQTIPPFFNQTSPNNFYDSQVRNDEHSNFQNARQPAQLQHNYYDESQIQADQYQQPQNYLHYDNPPYHDQGVEQRNVQEYQSIQQERPHSRNYQNASQIQRQSRMDQSHHHQIPQGYIQQQKNYQAPQQQNDYFYQSNAFQQNPPRWADKIDEGVDYGDVHIPSGPPPCFTNQTLETQQYTQTQQPYAQRRRLRTESEGPRGHHRPVEGGASEQGYLLGGMDFIDHSQDTEYNINYNSSDLETEEQRQKRLEILERREREHGTRRQPSAPGHFYGLDYSSEATAPTGEDFNTYQGYTAQQPRRHWKYNPNPEAVTLNTYEMSAVDGVDPMRLVGDTLSNQKLTYEYPLTEEEKRTFGTSFAPPPGFKPEHKTVRVEPKSPEPICFSVSAKKDKYADTIGATSTPGSRAQHATFTNSMDPFSSRDSSWYTSGNKEIMRNEPNWQRSVRQRGAAWEHQSSRSADGRTPVNWLGSSRNTQQPYWTGRGWQSENPQQANPNQLNRLNEQDENFNTDEFAQRGWQSENPQQANPNQLNRLNEQDENFNTDEFAQQHRHEIPNSQIGQQRSYPNREIQSQNYYYPNSQQQFQKQQEYSQQQKGYQGPNQLQQQNPNQVQSHQNKQISRNIQSTNPVNQQQQEQKYPQQLQQNAQVNKQQSDSIPEQQKQQQNYQQIQYQQRNRENSQSPQHKPQQQQKQQQQQQRPQQQQKLQKPQEQNYQQIQHQQQYHESPQHKPQQQSNQINNQKQQSYQFYNSQNQQQQQPKTLQNAPQGRGTQRTVTTISSNNYGAPTQNYEYQQEQHDQPNSQYYSTRTITQPSSTKPQHITSQKVTTITYSGDGYPKQIQSNTQHSSSNFSNLNSQNQSFGQQNFHASQQQNYQVQPQQQRKQQITTSSSAPNSPNKMANQAHYPQSPSNNKELTNSSISSRQYTYDYPPISSQDELYGGHRPQNEQKWQQQQKSKGLATSGIGSNYLQNIQQIHSTGRPQQTAVSRQFTSASNQNTPKQQQQKPQQYNRELKSDNNKSALSQSLQNELGEQLPPGQLANAYSDVSGQFLDENGYTINYRRELSHASDPHRESQLLTHQEQRIIENPSSENGQIMNRYAD